MMAGRPDGAEGILRLSRHHRVHRRRDGADGAKRRLAGSRRQNRVGIERGAAVLRDAGQHGLDESLAMHARRIAFAAQGRFPPQKRAELRLVHGFQDRRQAPR
jgi:hypothetical protein